MDDKRGCRIYEIQKGQIPKEVYVSCDIDKLESLLRNEKILDLDNKTYAIRIGKEGLK